jgi:hypothetical protein
MALLGRQLAVLGGMSRVPEGSIEVQPPPFHGGGRWEEVVGRRRSNGCCRRLNSLPWAASKRGVELGRVPSELSPLAGVITEASAVRAAVNCHHHHLPHEKESLESISYYLLM